MIFTKKGFTTIGAILFMMFSLPGVSSTLIKLQTVDAIYEVAEEVPEANVALVLGAAAYPTRMSDILKDRVDSAIELYNSDKITKIIMSGAPNEVEKMVEYALSQGVEENDLIEDPEGLNTFASIKNAGNISKLIIVSQKYHLPRALFIANNFGIESYGFASDRHSYDKIFDFKVRELLATSKVMMDLFFSK
jgi:SanA protein